MKITDCDLLERVAWVDDAVSALDIGTSPLTCYLIRDGFIHATNGRMVAATPFPFDLEGEWLVPAEAFTRVLKNRPEGDFEWFSEPGTLILKRGRFKGKIKLLPADQWVYPVDKVVTAPLPEAVVQALRAVLPFCSDNATKPWATCVLFKDGGVWASNNITVVRAACGYWEEVDRMLPRWAAEFICQRADGLDGWVWSDTACTFNWVDGSWMRTSLVEDRFPPVEKVLEQHYDATNHVDITKSWRTAVQRVTRITADPVVRLREDGVYGAQGEVLAVEDDATTPVPEGAEETIWDMRFLEPVIENASSWNPRQYPQPCSFMGAGFHGVIIGRRD